MVEELEFLFLFDISGLIYHIGERTAQLQYGNCVRCLGEWKVQPQDETFKSTKQPERGR